MRHVLELGGERPLSGGERSGSEEAGHRSRRALARGSQPRQPCGARPALWLCALSLACSFSRPANPSGFLSGCTGHGRACYS